MKDLARSGGSRAMTLLVSLVLITYSTRLVIAYVGTELYGYIALVASLSALLAFSDLGIGAAVTTEIARLGHAADLVKDLISRVGRALNWVSILLVLAAALALVFDLWPLIFANPNLPTYIPVAASISLVFFAVSVRAGVGYRVLIGINRSHLAIYCQVLGPVISTAICFVVVTLGGAPIWLAIAIPAGSMVVSVAMLVVAMRATGLNLVSSRSTRSLAKADRLSIANYSFPAFAILIASPIIFQSDRLLLAWLSTPAALAQYSVLAQLYGPAVSLANAVALPLWARYSSGGTSNLGREFKRHVLLLSVLGFALGGGLIVIEPFYVQVVSAGELGDLTLLASSFALLIVVQSVQLPASMFLTTPRGFRVLSLLFGIALIFKLALSFLLVPPLSGPGPVISSVIAVLLSVTIPSLFVVARSIQKGVGRI